MNVKCTYLTKTVDLRIFEDKNKKTMILRSKDFDNENDHEKNRLGFLEIVSLKSQPASASALEGIRRTTHRANSIHP